MATLTDIQYQIDFLKELFDDYIQHNDSVSFTDENLKEYVTSDTLLSNTAKSSQTAIQELENEKNNSLIEYEYIVPNDTTIFNICFATYGIVNETNIEQLIDANDLHAFNRTDIDPNDPIIKRGTKILYYK